MRRLIFVRRAAVYGASYPFPLATWEVGYLNGHRPFRLGGGNGFSWMTEKFWCLSQLFVRPEMQAKGIGQALLSKP